MQLALPNVEPGAERRLPAAARRAAVQHADLPAVHRCCGWSPSLLALAGPLAGLYYRYTDAGEQFAAAARQPRRLCRVAARRNASCASPSVRRPQRRGHRRRRQHHRHLRSALPPSMPVNEEALAEHANDPAYIALGNLLFGTDDRRGPADRARPQRPGARRHRHHRRPPYRRRREGARHLAQDAELHRPAPRPRLPVPAVGGLAAAPPQCARRGQLDPVACRAADDRGRAASSVFLAHRSDVPRWLNVAIYDLGNVLLLAGILLFPHGNLSWRAVGADRPACRSSCSCKATLYQTFFVCFMITGVLAAAALPAQTRSRASSASRSAGRCSGSPAMPCSAAISIVADYLKWSTRQLRPAAAGRDGRRASASRSPCWSSSSGCWSRCCATGSTTPRSSSAGRPMSR